jgi:hypothetical protein
MNEQPPTEAEQVAATVHDLQTIVNRVREAVATDQPATDPELRDQLAAAIKALGASETELAQLRGRLLTLLGDHNIATHRIEQIRDAARLHRQQLISTSELYATIEALDPPTPGPDTTASCSSAAPETEPNNPELTAEEARNLADELSLDLYRAQDALAFVGECCTIAEREGRTITTAHVREWLKGARCGRQLAADWEQQDDGTWKLPFRGGIVTVPARLTAEERTQFAAALQHPTPPAPAHDSGPTVTECAAADAAHWDSKYAGDQADQTKEQ